MSAHPTVATSEATNKVGPLLGMRALTKHFPIRRGVLQRTSGYVRAVDGVDLDIGAGQSVGLVGESGSGKTTLGRLALRLVEPTGGTITFEDTDVTRLKARELRRIRRKMQMVFQDPYSSMDPRSTVADSVAEPLRTQLGLRGSPLDDRIVKLFAQVGLPSAYRRRYPHEFSGGQLQRIAVARALAADPRLVVLDEPVSSLDVSTKAEIINLLTDLQDELGVAYLLIGHDIAVVRHASHRIAVMYLGRIVEQGDADTVYNTPKHPYTQALLSAVPVPSPMVQRRRERIVLEGDLPSPANPPAGCRFHTRCPYVMDICRTVDPAAITTLDGTAVACHLVSGPSSSSVGAGGSLGQRT